MLQDPELAGAALLVYANKQDVAGALSVSQIAERMGITRMRGREWHVEATSARNGEGLYEGLDWLAQTLNRRK